MRIRSFHWNRHTIGIAELSTTLAGVRILHLSDAHLRATWHPALDELIDCVAQDPPELVCWTGDFVDDKYDPRSSLGMVERLVTALRGRSGTFAVIGNHDGDLMAARLEYWGVRILRNQWARVDVGKSSLELVGVAGVEREDLDLPSLHPVPPRTPGVPRIAMGHFPDLVCHAAELQPDLFLAGHTHGGQICFPSGRPLITHDSLPAHMAGGLHRVNGAWLSVSRGLGFSGWPIRLFCPAEVVEIVLQPGAAT